MAISFNFGKFQSAGFWSLRGLAAAFWLILGSGGLLGQEKSALQRTSHEEANRVLEANLTKFLPNTLAALKKRESFAVTILGDGVPNYFQFDPKERGNHSKAWHATFLDWLASSYFFTGGVVFEGKASKKKSSEGPEEQATARSLPGDTVEPLPLLQAYTSGPYVAARVMARDGASLVQAFQSLTTAAFDEAPPLVILHYGWDEAQQGTGLKTFENWLTDAVGLCQKRGVDVILVTPPLLLGQPWAAKLGQTRAYAQILKETANRLGVLCFDSGAAQVRREMETTLPELEMEDILRRHLLDQYSRQEKPVETYVLNAAGHLLLAKQFWSELSQAPPQNSGIPGHTVRFTPGQGQAPGQLSFQMKAAGKERVVFSLLGCDRARRPVEPLGVLSIIPAEQPTFTLDLATEPEKERANGARLDLPYAEEPQVRGASLVYTRGVVRLADFIAPIGPVAITLPLGRLDKATGTLRTEATIHNSLTQKCKGTLNIRWRGHSTERPLELLPGAPMPVPLLLPLPASIQESGAQFKSGLQLSLTLEDGTRYHAKREVECSAHMPLDFAAPLQCRATACADLSAEERKASASEVTATVMADQGRKGIYFVVELPPSDALRGSKIPSAIVEITLDGRGPEKQGKPGFVEPIRLEVPWGDERIETNTLRPALFGDGYDRELDPALFPASVKTMPTGRRQVRLSIPKPYFYLHPWQMGPSGDNRLGYNISVALAEVTPEDPDGGFPLHRSYSLVAAGLPRQDATALAVLELHPARSAFWCAKFY